ncbi:MAG: tyrosine-type recombinase/integrase [Gemmatimonadetes bacterium]|nr:tyrosine-type recombinase/integrase [Gemmatimonadota bacterium]
MLNTTGGYAVRKPLTTRQVSKLSGEGLHWVDDTLYLSIKPSGRKHWIQRVKFPWERRGKRHDIGLGAFPIVSPEKARKAAMKNRVAIYEGRNPIPEKEVKPTFEAIAKEYFEIKRTELKTQANYKQWVKSIENHVFPSLAILPVDVVDQNDVIKILKPMWLTKPSMARSVRQRIREILDYARAHNHVDENVADERINRGLPSKQPDIQHHEYTPYNQMPAAYQKLETVPLPPVRLALRLLILTGLRGSEVLGARWSEFDFADRIWVIPAGRMKGKKPHRIPLTDAMVGILEQARGMDIGNGLVFPGVKNSSEMGTQLTSRYWGKLGFEGKPHGFRSTLKSWALECTEYDRELIELCLAHEVGNKTARSYDHTDLLEKRRGLMQAWSDYVNGASV